MRTQMVFGALAVVVALAGRASAAESVPDPSMQREFSAKLLVCNTCHGDRGTPKSANIPIMWAQQENYLLKQLHDFDKGDRNVEDMTWMTKTLTPAEQAPSATNFAKKTWPAKAAAAAPPAPRGIGVCQACPQPNYLGAVQAEGVTTQRLAGQTYEYLVESRLPFAECAHTD